MAVDCNPIIIIKRAIDLARSENSKQPRLVEFVNPFDVISPALVCSCFFDKLFLITVYCTTAIDVAYPNHMTVHNRDTHIERLFLVFLKLLPYPFILLFI